MKINDNTFFYKRVALLPDSTSRGLLWAALGVLGFSFSLPATRLAAPELGAVVVGLGRAVLASVFAGLLLWRVRAKLPSRGQLLSLVVVALGVVVGFPLLTALALREVPSSHATVTVGLVPLLTAAVAARISPNSPTISRECRQRREHYSHQPPCPWPSSVQVSHS